MAVDDIDRAIRLSAERLWEWLRDLMDLYQLDTGDEDPLRLPPWGELSEGSQGLFVLATGHAAVPMMNVLTFMPEVE